MKRANHDVDHLAGHLRQWARMAKNMPPAFLGAGISEPIMGPEGQFLGRMLDGKGLALNHDLQSLGITKRIPHVYERSPLQRLLEKLGDDRAAINTYDAIINARANGNADDLMIEKASYTTVANVWSTTFRSDGFPRIGTYTNIPTGAVLDRTNVGALSLGFTNPTGGNTKYLLTFGYSSAQQINMAMLVDQLVGAGNISATSAVAQTTSTAALTRYTTGAGVYATLDVTTALGGSASNFNLSSYTNQAGTGAQVGPAQAMTTSAIVQRLQPAVTGPQIGLASGDYGIQAVQTVTFSATMAAGVVALILYKPLTWVPGLVASVYGEKDVSTSIDGLIQLQTASGVLGCLSLYVLTNTTSTGLITGAMRGCQG